MTSERTRGGGDIAALIWRDRKIDFDLSEEQRLLKESVDGLLTDAYDFEQRKKYMKEKGGWSRAVWGKLPAPGPLRCSFCGSRWRVRRRRRRDHDRDGGARQGADAGALSGDRRDCRRLPAP